MKSDNNISTLSGLFKKVRNSSVEICRPLETEDYVVQPIADVSPPKWHLGHTTWFFETFILREFVEEYKEFNENYNYVFNSYYEAAGVRVMRTDRGNLSRPTVSEVMQYRIHVDNAVIQLLQNGKGRSVDELVILGLNHEQQHQELLLMDIKYILGHNPLFPTYLKSFGSPSIIENIEEKYLQYTIGNNPAYKEYGDLIQESQRKYKVTEVNMPEGTYDIGTSGDGFYWDNELGRHKVYLENYRISQKLVTNGEYLNFIRSGGYSDFKYWHSAGWEWVKEKKICAPLYWHLIGTEWYVYTFRGIEKLEIDEPVAHVSYFEAYAYAQYMGKRLPSEFEWEAAAAHFPWGLRWEWTESAYLPYPRYKKAVGALGEYNGKFMVGQQVLRGASEATPPGHSRHTYRNFFQAEQRWQLTGIRLVER